MFGQKLTPTEYRTEAQPKATAGNIPVFCAHDSIVPIDDLEPNPRNPNKHPEPQVKLLAEIIKAQGWRSPITVSNLSGYIVKGHGRLLAAKEAGFSHVPVDYQDYATDAEEMTDLTADNRLSELSSMDNDMLADLLSYIQEADIDTILTGYDEEDITAILESLAGDEDDEPVKDDGPTTEPLCKAGDTWYLGENCLIVADSSFEELKAVDDAIRGYILHTGNVLCTCIRDCKKLEYMNLIQEWAEYNEMEEILDKKIPVVKNRE